MSFSTYCPLIHKKILVTIPTCFVIIESIGSIKFDNICIIGVYAIKKFPDQNTWSTCYKEVHWRESFSQASTSVFRYCKLFKRLCAKYYKTYASLAEDAQERFSYLGKGPKQLQWKLSKINSRIFLLLFVYTHGSFSNHRSLLHQTLLVYIPTCIVIIDCIGPIKFDHVCILGVYAIKKFPDKNLWSTCNKEVPWRKFISQASTTVSSCNLPKRLCAKDLKAYAFPVEDAQERSSFLRKRPKQLQSRLTKKNSRICLLCSVVGTVTSVRKLVFHVGNLKSKKNINWQPRIANKL